MNRRIMPLGLQELALLSRRRLCGLLLVATLVSGCSGGSEAKDVTTSTGTETNPCVLLTEALVRDHLEVPATTAVEQKDDSDARFPSCGYRWRVMPEEEESARRDENIRKLKENIAAGRSPNEGIQHSFPTHATARLTAVPFGDSDQALSALETVHERMTKGFEFEAAGKQRTYEPKKAWNPVEGVGARAYYHGSQLSFAQGDMLVHLDAKPVETAIALAHAVFR